MRLLKNCTVKDFTEFVIKDFEKINVEVQVRTSNVGTFDVKTIGLPQFYEDNVRDILLGRMDYFSGGGKPPNKTPFLHLLEQELRAVTSGRKMALKTIPTGRDNDGKEMRH